MARAGLFLFEETGNGAYLVKAKAWADTAERHYADPAGGYFMSADDTGPPIARPRSSADDATPGGRGSMRSEEHTSDIQSLMPITYAVLCLNKNKYYTK